MYCPRLSRGSVFTALVCLAAAVLPSCRPVERTGKVSGTVLYQGRPLTKGDVNFHLAEKGVGAIASLDSSGRFTFSEPLPIGTYAVYVTPLAPEPFSKAPTPKSTNIPLKYRDPKSSGLSFEVKAGKNDCPIELTD